MLKTKISEMIFARLYRNSHFELHFRLHDRLDQSFMFGKLKQSEKTIVIDAMEEMNFG